MATALTKVYYDSDSKRPNIETTTTSASQSTDDIPALGAPTEEKRFWWQRGQAFDKQAVATQPSVFDDPDTAERYQPPKEWENTHRFDPNARWTWGEEYSVLRKIDFRIMIWACVMFMALELDRSNLSQALTDNFLGDLNLDTNDLNFGNTVFRLSFLCAEIPSQLVSKWMGPDRWIPMQMVLWSLVAGGQFWLSGKSSFLACRSLLGLLQGGFIPDVVLYLSYFYKHHELSLRLTWFWGMMAVADILASILAYGILHMRGVGGHAGWQWLYLLEGLLTLVIGLFSFVLMPAGPCQTASWYRGKNGWFNSREETIMVNRVLREDPSKSSMHNREPVTPKLLWKSLSDYDLWPLYIIGLMFNIPSNPSGYYLTLSLRGLGFSTFQSNLLAIPSGVLAIFTMFILTTVSEFFQEATLTSMFGQIWVFPFLVWLKTSYTLQTNRWISYTIISLLLSWPSPHPIQVSWNSRNSNTVRSRTVSAAAYNMFVQLGGIISANIYREHDKPLYRRGNGYLLAILSTNIVIYLLTKVYYVRRNKTRAAKWDALSEDEKLEYLATTKDEGNKRLDFRFHH